MAENETQDSSLAEGKSVAAKTTKKMKKSETKTGEMKKEASDPDAATTGKPRKKKSKSNIVGLEKEGGVNSSAADENQDKKKSRRASKSPVRATSKKSIKPKELEDPNSPSTRSSRSVSAEDPEKQRRKSKSSKSPMRASSKKKIGKSTDLDNTNSSRKSRTGGDLSPKRPSSKKLGSTKGELDTSNKSPSSRSTRSVKSLASAGDEDKKKSRRTSSSSPKSASKRKLKNTTAELENSTESPPSNTNRDETSSKPAEDEEKTKSATRRSFTSLFSAEDQEKKKGRSKSTLSSMFPRRRSFTSLLSAEAQEKKKARRKSVSSLSPKRASSKKNVSSKTTEQPISNKIPPSTAPLEPPLIAMDQEKKQSKKVSSKSPRRPSSKKKATCDPLFSSSSTKQITSKAAAGASKEAKNVGGEDLIEKSEIATSTIDTTTNSINESRSQWAFAGIWAPFTKEEEAAPLRSAGSGDDEVSSNLSQAQVERPVVYNDPWRGIYAAKGKEASSIPLVPSYGDDRRRRWQNDDDDDRRRRNSFFLTLSAAKDEASKKRDIIFDGFTSSKSVYCLIGIAMIILVVGAVVGFAFTVGGNDSKLTTADHTIGGRAKAPSSSESQACGCFQYKHTYNLSDRRSLEKSTPKDLSGQQNSDFKDGEDIRNHRSLELSNFKNKHIRNLERTMVMLTVDFAPSDSQQSNNFEEGSQTRRHRHLVREQQERHLLQQSRRHLLAEDDHRNEVDDVLIETSAIFWDSNLNDDNSQLDFSYLLAYCVTDERILRPNEYVQTIHSNLQEWMGNPDHTSYLLELLTSNGALPSGGNSLSGATRGFNCDEMQ